MSDTEDVPVAEAAGINEDDAPEVEAPEADAPEADEAGVDDEADTDAAEINAVISPAEAAAAVAAKLMADHGQQAFPVSSGADHAQVRSTDDHQPIKNYRQRSLFPPIFFSCSQTAGLFFFCPRLSISPRFHFIIGRRHHQ